MSNWNHDTILLVFIGLTTLALVVQAIVAIALFASVNKATRSMKEQIDDLRGSVLPVMQQARQVIDRIGPRIDPLADDIAAITANVKSASADFVDIAHKLRKESEDVQVSAHEAMERLRQQSARVDGMVTEVLNAADKAGNFVQRTVAAPARQLAGVLAAAKAVVESLRSPDNDYRPARDVRDKDMFV